MSSRDRWCRTLGVWAVVACAACRPVFPAILLRVGQNFTGTTYGVLSTASPPDAGGACGPSHFVELVNGRYSVYNKANGVRMQTMTDASFWARAGVSLAKDWGVTEPRIIFDSQTQRWFALQIDDAECSCAIGPAVTNRFLLAVSGNANPLGSWNGFGIPSDPTGNTFADFPTLGLDAQGVYMSAAMFDAGDNLMGFTLVSLPKAALVAAKPTVAGATSFGIM